MNQAVIIAAGRGAKLGALTRDRPRPMLPVLGKPVIARIMDRMREAGINHFIVVLGENEGEVASYLSGGWAPGVKVQIVLQPTPRGPAEALAAAASYLTGPFLITSGDHFVPPNHMALLMKRFQSENADLVLSLTPYAREQHLPIVTIDEDRVTAISQSVPVQRRSLSSFLVMACAPGLLKYLGSSGPLDSELAGAVQAMINAGSRVGFVSAEWHMPLTREIDLLTINKRFLREERDTHILSEIPGTVHIVPPVRIDPQVSVGQGAKIGPNVYLESGAQVGQGAVIWDTVVLGKAEIPANEVAHSQIVLRRERIYLESEGEKTNPVKPDGLREYLEAQNKLPPGTDGPKGS